MLFNRQALPFTELFISKLAFALLTSVQLPLYLSVLHLVFLFCTF